MEETKPTGGEEPQEAGGDNRSVMPLDVLGCTRATIVHVKEYT